MAAVDITARLRTWIEKAINDGCMGEEFWFDASVGTKLTPAGPQVRYTVIITMKNPMLGQGPIIVPFQVPLHAMREDAVRMATHAALGQARELHKKILDNRPKLIPGGRHVHS